MAHQWGDTENAESSFGFLLNPVWDVYLQTKGRWDGLGAGVYHVRGEAEAPEFAEA